MSKRKLTVVMVGVMLAFGILACNKAGGGHGKGQPINVTGGVIELNGGTGISSGYGGSGGHVDVEWNGSGGVKLLQAGHIDVDFPNPNYPNADNWMYLGANSLEVDADMAISVYDTSNQNPDGYGCPGATREIVPAEPADSVRAGQYHLHFNDTTLYQRNATNDCDIPVTGLLVDADKTLTLGLNINNGGPYCNETSFVWFENDVVIEGKLTVDNLLKGIDFNSDIPCNSVFADNETRNNGDAANSNDMGALELISGHHIIIGEGGLLDTSGKPQGTLARGGDGGGISLWGQGGVFVLESRDGLTAGAITANGGATGTGTNDGGWGAVWADGFSWIDRGVDVHGGMVINFGTITAFSGGGTRYGGMAGSIELSADTFLWNYGDLDSHGGNGGADSFGGYAGDVCVGTMDGGLYNEGNIFANGGNGNPGGNGGNVELSAAGGPFSICSGGVVGLTTAPVAIDNYGVGDLISRAETIKTNGGSGAGDAGDAGNIDFLGAGGVLKIIGAIYAVGGNGGTGDTWGGDGGDVSFNLNSGFYDDLSRPHGDMIIAAQSIILDGGDGYLAGDGGNVQAADSCFGDEPDLSLTATAYLIGFGGYEGNDFIGIEADGGNGADSGRVTTKTQRKATTVDGGGCSYGPFTSSGLCVTTYSAKISSLKQPCGRILNELNVEALGGDASDGYGGYGGIVYLTEVCENSDDDSTAVNTGDLYLNGGQSAAVGDNLDTGGGNGGLVQIYGYKLARNTGAIVANGGSCTGMACGGGGGGGEIRAIKTEKPDGIGGLGILITAPYIAENTGPITINGGDGIDYGGDGGFIEIKGGKKGSNSGYLEATGGDATGAAPGWGGDGGMVRIISEEDQSSTSKGHIVVTPGTGLVDTRNVGGDGMMGHIFFDLLDVTPPDGIW